jgi:hypothetical protein
MASSGASTLRKLMRRCPARRGGAPVSSPPSKTRRAYQDPRPPRAAHVQIETSDANGLGSCWALAPGTAERHAIAANMHIFTLGRVSSARMVPSLVRRRSRSLTRQQQRCPIGIDAKRAALITRAGRPLLSSLSEWMVSRTSIANAARDLATWRRFSTRRIGRRVFAALDFPPWRSRAGPAPGGTASAWLPNG